MVQLGVVGAGTMGTGVAQLFAENGTEVVLVDVARAALDRAREQIRDNLRLAHLVRGRGAEPVPVDEVMGRIRFSADLDELGKAGYVVENITENWDAKRRLYAELDEVCPPDTPFGVNTSAIAIGRVAGVTGRPDKVVGTHFMNPAPLKPTVEVIRGFHTSEDTLRRTADLLAAAGRKHIVVGDSAGFVTNRVAMLTVNEAIFLLHEGVADARSIDRLFKECFGHPMGPLATADLIGLDTVLYSLEVLYQDFNDPKYRPCPLLRRMVEAGRHGRKTGHGFHPYETTAASRGDQADG
jgi:3-hydroxybutyryl-CoA dehydrogenase